MSKITKATLTARIAELESQLKACHTIIQSHRQERDEYVDVKNKAINRLATAEGDHRYAMVAKDKELRATGDMLEEERNSTQSFQRRFMHYCMAVANPETAKDAQYIQRLQAELVRIEPLPPMPITRAMSPDRQY